MVALLRTRTARRDMKMLAQRIDLSQADEIKMMQAWLRGARPGGPGPARDAHARRDADAGHAHAGGNGRGSRRRRAPSSIGSSSKGMIKHHGGALTMVTELFASAGAAQESEIFAFASDVDADQRMEIDRMGAMLNAIKERQK